jgi:hypothetical protein
MNPRRRFLDRAVAASTLALAAVTAAQAGPPLICWKVETNDAPSLPWVENPRSYEGMDPAYPRSRLAKDTLALLAPGTPVLARMETIRRAVLYASKDSTAEESLLSSLVERTKRHTDDALAWFDAGYFVEARKQALGKNSPELWNKLVASLGLRPNGAEDLGKPTGYECVLEAIELNRGDAELEYAAALVTWHPQRPEHEGHLARATAGATPGSLLEKNLLKNFSNRGRTLAELRASVPVPTR